MCQQLMKSSTFKWLSQGTLPERISSEKRFLLSQSGQNLLVARIETISVPCPPLFLADECLSCCFLPSILLHHLNQFYSLSHGLKKTSDSPGFLQAVGTQTRTAEACRLVRSRPLKCEDTHYWINQANKPL